MRDSCPVVDQVMIIMCVLIKVNLLSSSETTVIDLNVNDKIKLVENGMKINLTHFANWGVVT